MDRNTRVTTKVGPATVVGRLEDGRIILDADLTDPQLLAIAKEAEISLMKTAADVKNELEEAVLSTKAELQDTTENYWRRFIADIKAIFVQKLAFLRSVKTQAKAKIVALKLDASTAIKEYNSGRRY